jgi:putative membrane-bound dehydrogenase-like protein
VGLQSLTRGFLCLATVLGLATASPGESLAQGLAPDEAVARMKLPDGLEASVVAAEPLVKQPVAIEFDDRGRLWVIQYLQYPNPEGLKRVTVDRFSRTKYDRVPEPPPHGPRGADRITILEDTDGDGRADRSKDFVSGLNLTSGFAFGHGGVFVLNVPYLLFYPDRDRDDVPDSDPEVLLTGFGMEDAHSVANSLAFGPDGWLYGCQGSTVTANVRSIEFQQGVWRYHPITKAFELFCEGGGNSWGLDFDRTGQLFYSTNWGGFRMLHAMQGGYYIKSFGKHGALHNPHAYGYFDHVPHESPIGGHVTVGGIVYQGDNLPKSFRDTYIAGDLLGHGVYWSTISERGSTVKTAHAGELLAANDPWFASTDVTLGPDGAVYVSDWHDARTAHPDPDADWDRTNGRVYRIAAKGSAKMKPFNLAKLSIDELVKMHQHPSQFYVRRARQELVRRRDSRNAGAMSEGELKSLAASLLKTATESVQEITALEALWTYHSLVGVGETQAVQLLENKHASVRAWTIRFLGDRVAVDGTELSHEMAERLDELAEQETEVRVRQQIACSAQRFPAAQAMPMINANINRDLDHDFADPYIPLLWWWAVEKHSVSGREEVLKRFVRPTLWKSRLGRDVLLTRLIRRYAAEKTTAGLDSVERLLRAAPDDQARNALWPHILLGWQEQPNDKNNDWLAQAQSHAFAKMIRVAMKASPENQAVFHLGVLLRQPEAIAAAFAKAFDPKQDSQARITALKMLSPLADASLVEPAIGILASNQSEPVQLAALDALAGFDDVRLSQRLIELHEQSASAAVQARIRDVLLGRPGSAKVWLEAVDSNRIAPAVTSLEQIRRVALLGDESLDKIVVKHWGKLDGGSREEKLAEVRRLQNDVRAAPGNWHAGKQLFTKHCAACHTMWGEGAKIGPDLTAANRQDREFLLISLVDPSSVIRKEYVSVVVNTKSGRVITGMPIARGDAAITLADSKGQKQEIPAGEIEEINDSSLSLMPDDLYRQFKPQELRDLFAFLQGEKRE